MRSITEQMIAALAPNPAAAANGRKISQKGGFVRLEQSADDTFFLGECTGSGSNHYITTADFVDPAQPVFRCSCPSRQFPCKHSLALLYEMMAGKPFAACEIPDDILQKRARKQARTEKAEGVQAQTKPAAPPKINKAARSKKLKKQLEGLELTAGLVRDLLKTGLGAMGGAALGTYREVQKQLGDYYLPGPQRLLGRLILEINAFQRDGDDVHYERAVEALERLEALVKKSRQYLTAKLESGEVEQDENWLFEELGGIWKLTDLAALGLVKRNVRLAQLSFWVTYDEAGREYVDTGCWADVDTGEVSLTQNYRPEKALKYIKQDDTVFGAAVVPEVYYYPGEGNRRVRWEGMELTDLTPDDLEKLRNAAVPLAQAVKEAKTWLKNTLSAPYYIRLLRMARIGRTAEGIAMADGDGGTILLGDMPELEPTVARLGILPDPALLEQQVLLGALYYDKTAGRLNVQPLSILTKEQVVRLLY